MNRTLGIGLAWVLGALLSCKSSDGDVPTQVLVLVDACVNASSATRETG